MGITVHEAKVNEDGTIQARAGRAFGVRASGDKYENDRGEVVHEHPQHQMTAEVILDGLELETILQDVVNQAIIDKQGALRKLGAEKLEAFAKENKKIVFHHEDAGKQPQFTTPEERERAANKAMEQMSPEELEAFIERKQKELAG